MAICGENYRLRTNLQNTFDLNEYLSITNNEQVNLQRRRHMADAKIKTACAGICRLKISRRFQSQKLP
jgi:hypothetical protein